MTSSNQYHILPRAFLPQGPAEPTHPLTQCCIENAHLPASHPHSTSTGDSSHSLGRRKTRALPRVCAAILPLPDAVIHSVDGNAELWADNSLCCGHGVSEQVFGKRDTNMTFNVLRYSKHC